MRGFSILDFRFSIVRVFLVALLVGSASPEVKAQAPVYATPQAAFDGGMGALKGKHYRVFVDSLTDDSQTLFAGAMVMVAGMIAAFSKMDQHPRPEQKAAIQKLANVLNKHGLTEKYLNSESNAKPPTSQKRADIVAAFGKLLGPVKDKRAFLTDLMGALDSMPGDKGFSSQVAGTRLTSLKVTGSHATAQMIAAKPGKKPDPIAFKKEGPGWKIELPESDFRKVSGGPPGR